MWTAEKIKQTHLCRRINPIFQQKLHWGSGTNALELTLAMSPDLHLKILPLWKLKNSKTQKKKLKKKRKKRLFFCSCQQQQQNNSIKKVQFWEDVNDLEENILI